MKIESNKNWTTCLRLNTGDGSPRVFLLNSHFLGSVPIHSVRRQGLLLTFADIFIVMETTVPARAKVSLPIELQRASRW